MAFLFQPFQQKLHKSFGYFHTSVPKGKKITVKNWFGTFPVKLFSWVRGMTWNIPTEKITNSAVCHCYRLCSRILWISSYPFSPRYCCENGDGSRLAEVPCAGFDETITGTAVHISPFCGDLSGGLAPCDHCIKTTPFCICFSQSAKASYHLVWERNVDRWYLLRGPLEPWCHPVEI